MTLSFAALILVALFCLAVGIREVRRKDYIWAVTAFVVAGLVIIIPIPSHALKVELPIAD